ncbi:phenylphosphate carboxylase subunit delta [Oryzomicrobium sp.]|uniref:KdsC family phosphatase n=1 Tax=Oryzomicrobium sp. TaxID=1911578 RepID=UPI0025CB9F43|nr:phenylphosphate carboxylase subunit delta [Oryzomicrobium sp.]MCE1241651.1 phenylphosphate carboxylase subunit delta [Oryzomicrobium sp.]
MSATTLKLMAFDVDGVMTDGRLYFTDDGSEVKAFHTLDGQGLKMLAGAGVQLAIITGRRSNCVAHRAHNLGIDLLFQGVHDKHAVMADLLKRRGLTFAEAGYMGDDVVDLPVMRACGFSATPANGHAVVKQYATLTTQLKGGEGAVREVCDHLLAAQDRLEAALAPYLVTFPDGAAQ